jgi:hypothetical protein
LLGLIVLLMFSGSMMSSEFSRGTARLIAVRPVLRSEFVLAKILLGMTYAVVWCSGWRGDVSMASCLVTVGVTTERSRLRPNRCAGRIARMGLVLPLWAQQPRCVWRSSCKYSAALARRWADPGRHGEARLGVADFLFELPGSALLLT